MNAHHWQRRGLVTAAGLVFAVAAGCSSSTTDTTDPPARAAIDAGTADSAIPKQEYAAVVRGKLASTDLAAAKASHDAIAKGGEAQAKAAGNFGHQPHLGTSLLDSTPNEFMSIDRWSDAKAMQAFYADPKIQEAFGGLFSGAPTVQFLASAPTWVSWGDLGSGKASTTWFNHLALGVLKDTDTEKNRNAHDQVASGGKEPSLGAGNVAHVVFLGLDDPRKFAAFDLWGKGDNIEGFYTNPQFKAGFAPLFESVSEPVFQSTDWHSW